MTRYLSLIIVLLLGAGCSPGQLDTEQVQNGTGGQGGSGGTENTGSGGTGGESPDAAAIMPDADLPCVGGAMAVKDPMTGHCFMFFANQVSYAAAASSCGNMGMGYHLATVTTASEQTAVAQLNGVNAAWIGFSDSSVEGTFRWITGEMSTYTNWATGEPNNGAGGLPENCTILDPNRQDQWDDRNCDNQYDYICERD